MTEQQKRKADVREARLCLAKARVELSRAAALLDERSSGVPQLPEYYEINKAFWAVDAIERRLAILTPGRSSALRGQEAPYSARDGKEPYSPSPPPERKEPR